jgi:hypothetical protein
MTANLDKSVAFDDSCAQEEALPAQALVLAAQKRPWQQGVKTPERLERLDCLMWTLCFLFGTLFGEQILPIIQSWWFGS